jgi:hypothetical protein
MGRRVGDSELKRDDFQIGFQEQTFALTACLSGESQIANHSLRSKQLLAAESWRLLSARSALSSVRNLPAQRKRPRLREIKHKPISRDLEAMLNSSAGIQVQPPAVGRPYRGHVSQRFPRLPEGALRVVLCVGL